MMVNSVTWQSVPEPPDFSAVRGARLLIALSGGADSTALAVMLAEARAAFGLRLSAAHMDHAIRPESAEDADWCRALCQRLDIDFHAVRVDVPALAAQSGEGLETVARRVRHGWLESLRQALGADYIAMAHHMDDQAETVLMHLLRGAGPEGLSGMAERSGALYRPLLGWRKDQLKAFLTERGFDWREDSTNALADTPRNALRLNVVPELERIWPRSVEAVARCAESVGVESDYVARQARAYVEGHAADGPGWRHLTIETDLHPALLRRAIRLIGGTGLSHDAVVTAANLRRGRLELTGSLAVERGLRGLYFITEAPPAPGPAPLRLEGDTALPGLCALTARAAPPVPSRNDPLFQVLDADTLAGCELRTRRPGDRVRPLGCGEKPLSDFFIDKKVDRPLRDGVALVARGRDVLWVCGMAIADSVRLTERTQRAVALRCAYEHPAVAALLGG